MTISNPLFIPVSNMQALLLLLSAACAKATVSSQDCAGAWGSWSGCSPSCGTGYQNRTYLQLQPRMGAGQPCNPAIGTTATQLCQNNQPCFVGQSCMIQYQGSQQTFSCVQVSNTSTQAVLVPCTGVPGQLWTIQPTSTVNDYTLVSSLQINGQQSCLMPLQNSGSGTQQSNVLAWACSNNQPYQEWTMATNYLNNGYIQNVGANLCLDFLSGTGVSTSSTPIIVDKCSVQSTTWVINCNQDCVYGDWGDWGTCSQLCGGGTQTQSRQSLLWGFSNCDATTQTQSCNAWACTTVESCLLLPVQDPYHLKCLSFAAGDYSLVARACTGETGQLWSYDGTYLHNELKIDNQPVCLTVQADLTLKAWPCNNGTDNSQKFSLYFDQLVSFTQGLCITITGGLNFQLTTQDVGLQVCTSSNSQNFQFTCVPSNACTGVCPSACLCSLDTNLNPYCSCPGQSCASVACLNGGISYYDGSQCLCSCPLGYSGSTCGVALECTYSAWSSWSICSKLCGGGQATQTRSALTFPNICTDLTATGSCNSASCTPVGVSSLPPATATPFGVTPFTGCLILPLDNPTMCLTIGSSSDATTVSPCSASQAAAQSWTYDGNLSITDPNGNSLDISGGLSGSNVITWQVNGGNNQEFTFSNNMIKSVDGRCLQYSNGQVYVSSCGNFQGWTTDCTSWPAAALATTSSAQTSVSAAQTAGCTFELDNTGRCLTVVNGNVNIAPCTGALAQKFIVNSVSQTIQSSLTGQCLNIEGGESGYNVIVWDCNGGNNEVFYPSGGTIMAALGQCVDAEYGISGTNAIVWKCNGQNNQLWNQNCNTTCNYGPWSAWTGCTETCGAGTQFRVRYVDPTLAAQCPDTVASSSCNVTACAACTFTDWTAWTPCSATCGGGFTQRYRVLTTTPPTGITCPATIDMTLCNSQACTAQTTATSQQGSSTSQQGSSTSQYQAPPTSCPLPTVSVSSPVDCVLGPWGAWSTCSASCGLGKRSQVSPIVVAAANGGQACPSNQQWQYCNPQSC
jgi:hypothetical protein